MRRTERKYKHRGENYNKTVKLEKTVGNVMNDRPNIFLGRFCL